MNSRKFVLRETLYLTIGLIVCSGIMIAVYALLGYLDSSVWLGALVGSLLGIANFFLLGVSADAAADQAVAQNVKGGKSTMRLSYMLRMIVMFVILFACAKSGLCNALAMVLPIFFVRPIITVIEFLRKSGE